MRWRWALVFCAATGSICTAASAGDNQFPNQSPSGGLKDLTLEQLSQIEVTSPSKAPTPAMRSPVAIYVITGEDIRRSGATTIPDALRLAPGVEVAQIDSSKWSIGIRGFGTRLSRAVLVLIDGRSVYTPLIAGTYWEVQDTLLEDIDRIEVIRGPGGTIWGPNAVDGVINIITKSTVVTQGTYGSTGGGSQEQGSFNSRYGGHNGGDLSYRIYAKGFTRGPEFHPNGNNFDDWRGIQGGFRMDWPGGQTNTFTLQGDIYKQNDGEQVNLSTYTPPAIRNVDGYETLSGGDALFKWNHTANNGNGFQLQASYDRTNRLEPNLGEKRDNYDVDFLARTRWGDRQHLIYGAGIRLSPGRFEEVVSGLVFAPLRRSDYMLSAFFEDDITLINNRLMLTAGSKILNTNYLHGVDFQPSVRLLWTPGERQTWWASFTHAVRTPSDAEEDFYLSSLIASSNGTPVFARFNANDRFSPEKLNAWEIGFRQVLRKNFYVDLSGFFNRYHNLFSEDVTGGESLQTTLPFPSPVPPSTYILLPAQFQNDLYGATYGGEIAPEWRPSRLWRLRGSYSFLRMSLKTAATPNIPLGPGQDQGSTPQHELSLDSGFDFTRRLQLDLIFRYVSALPYQGVHAYSTGDVRFAYRLGSHLELSLVGRNLFQPSHVEYVDDPDGPVGIRRSAYASLAWKSR
jgi:iron complex outermembrane receptor protein